MLVVLKIAICDDVRQDLKTTYEIVKKYLSTTNVEFQIDIFEEPQELINKAQEFNLIFLDIDLGINNGLEIARKINKLNYNYKLILISNYSEYLRDGYRVKADRYFVKPVDQDEFNMDMNDVLKEYIFDSSYIFDIKVCKSKIYIKDILYIEKLSRKTFIYTKNNVYTTNYTLLHWIELLEDFNFAQCHRAYYVNLCNIEDYNNNNIFFHENGEEYIVPISRFYKEDFVKRYTRYIGENV